VSYLIQDQYDGCWCEELFYTLIQATAFKDFMQNRIDPRIELSVRFYGRGLPHVRMEWYPTDSEEPKVEEQFADCEF
jgi:hypothetical protein